MKTTPTLTSLGQPFKPIDIELLSQRISNYVKSGTQPVLDVDSYYQAYREIE